MFFERRYEKIIFCHDFPTWPRKWLTPTWLRLWTSTLHWCPLAQRRWKYGVKCWWKIMLNPLTLYIISPSSSHKMSIISLPYSHDIPIPLSSWRHGRLAFKIVPISSAMMWGPRADISSTCWFLRCEISPLRMDWAVISNRMWPGSHLAQMMPPMLHFTYLWNYGLQRVSSVTIHTGYPIPSHRSSFEFDDPKASMTHFFS